MSDPYSILGVDRNATDEDVKRAYRKLSRQYHPDANINNPKKDEAEAKFKEVQQAYQQIMDEREKGYTSGYGSSDGSGYGGYDPFGGFGGFGSYGYGSAGSMGGTSGMSERQHDAVQIVRIHPRIHHAVAALEVVNRRFGNMLQIKNHSFSLLFQSFIRKAPASRSAEPTASLQALFAAHRNGSHSSAHRIHLG